MGNLTDSMTLLRGGVDRLRQEREEFTQGLRLSVSKLTRNVAQMLNTFRKAHAESARETRSGLNKFVSDLTENVAGIREAVALDLAGVRVAWQGASGAIAPVVRTEKRRKHTAKKH